MAFKKTLTATITGRGKPIQKSGSKTKPLVCEIRLGDGRAVCLRVHAQGAVYLSFADATTPVWHHIVGSGDPIHHFLEAAKQNTSGKPKSGQQVRPTPKPPTLLNANPSNYKNVIREFLDTPTLDNWERLRGLADGETLESPTWVPSAITLTVVKQIKLTSGFLAAIKALRERVPGLTLQQAKQIVDSLTVKTPNDL